MSVIYRTGATTITGQMVVSFDPYAGWAEAAVATGMPCVTWVGPAPPSCVLDGVAKLGEPNTTNL